MAATEEIILRYKADVAAAIAVLQKLQEEIGAVGETSEEASKKSATAFETIGKHAKLAGATIVATIGIAATKALKAFADDVIQAARSTDQLQKSGARVSAEYDKLAKILGQRLVPAMDTWNGLLAENLIAFQQAAKASFALQDGLKLLGKSVIQGKVDWGDLTDVIRQFWKVAAGDEQGLNERSLQMLRQQLAIQTKLRESATIGSVGYKQATAAIIQLRAQIDELNKVLDPEAEERKRQRAADAERKRQEERLAFDRETRSEEFEALQEELEEIDDINEKKLEKEEEFQEELTEIQRKGDDERNERTDKANEKYFEDLEKQKELEEEFEQFLLESYEKRRDSVIASSESVVSTLSFLLRENAAAQQALLVFQKFIDIAKVIIDTQTGISTATAAAAPFLQIPLLKFEAAATLASTISLLKTTAGISIATIAATAIPQFQALGEEGQGFAKGVIRLGGKGTRTSDSIAARLSRGESVMTADETDQHHGALMAMRKRKFDDYILADYLPKLASKNTDFATRLASALGYNQTGDTDKLLRQGNRNANRNADKLVKAIMHNSKKRGW